MPNDIHDDQCTCGHEDSDDRMDVLRCLVHGQRAVTWPDPVGFARRTEQALRIEAHGENERLRIALAQASRDLYRVGAGDEARRAADALSAS